MDKNWLNDTTQSATTPREVVTGAFSGQADLLPAAKAATAIVSEPEKLSRGGLIFCTKSFFSSTMWGKGRKIRWRNH